MSKELIKKHKEYINRSKQLNREFSLTYECAFALFKSPCWYCGDDSPNLRGIDRVDSRLGYSTDNVVPCCKICNRAKMDMSMFDFGKYCERFSVKKMELVDFTRLHKVLDHFSLWNNYFIDNPYPSFSSYRGSVKRVNKFLTSKEFRPNMDRVDIITVAIKREVFGSFTLGSFLKEEFIMFNKVKRLTIFGKYAEKVNKGLNYYITK